MKDLVGLSTSEKVKCPKCNSDYLCENYYGGNKANRPTLTSLSCIECGHRWKPPTKESCAECGKDILADLTTFRWEEWMEREGFIIQYLCNGCAKQAEERGVFSGDNPNN